MSKNEKYVLVLGTAPNIKTARRLADSILQARLAACVNLLPAIESRYWWREKLEKATEVLMLVKTIVAVLPALERLIVQQHPYDTPEFIVLPIARGNRRYLAWLSGAVAAAGDARMGKTSKRIS